LLAVRDGLDMVLIESVRPRTSMLSMSMDVGSRVPLPNSALGRAYLGAVPAVQREALIESLRLSRGTEWTVQSAALRLSLQDMQNRGHCVSLSEFVPEINSAAVPLRSLNGEVLSLNCGGPVHDFTERRLHEQIGPQLLATAQLISKELGVPDATQR
jgi:DNA-binding IclR family transcriptional regulator